MTALLLGAGRATGAAAAFNPASITGLVGWWKADVGTFTDAARTTPATADTDPIGGWADQSGGGNHFSQATAGKRPLLRTGAHGKNSLPVVHFDATDDGLLTTVTSLVIPYTVFAVALSHVVSGTQADRFLNGDDATNWVLSPRYSANATYFSGGFVSNSALATNGDQWYLLMGRTATGPTSALWVDGVDRTQSASLGSNPGHLCMGFEGTNPAKVDGDAGEILVYNSALSSTDYNNVKAYLAGRWGLTVT